MQESISKPFNTPVSKRKQSEVETSSEAREHPKRRRSSVCSAQLMAQEDKLQKLKLVSHYRKNHSLPQLERLTQCWTKAAQQALRDLQQRLQGREQDVAMADLLRHMGVDPELVMYDAETDSFSGAEEQ